MDWYYYIALVAIVSQTVFLIQMVKNYRYALAKYKKKRSGYCPSAALIVPCKGLDPDFEKNIASFFRQDYENYILCFVVADKRDPAYNCLTKLKDRLAQNSKAHDIRILIAGSVTPGTSSQKIHNLLHCCRQLADDIEILAFADSDVCVRTDWLSHIVFPLRKTENGASTGYRWFIPKTNNIAALALSAVNAKIAQLMGNTRFNLAWGGSMALRNDLFKQLNLEKIWQNSISDDLSLTAAVKKAGKKIIFAPACLVTSYESTTWKKFFEFGRRQFLITRVYAPQTWWFGLCSSIYSILGLWAGAALAFYAAATNDKNLTLYAAVPILFFVSQFSRAILRQTMVRKLLKQDRKKLNAACIADVFFSWLWSFVLLVLIASSAFGRTITWRQIKYKLPSTTETIATNRKL